MKHYEVSVIEHDDEKADLKQTTAGGAKSTAAWLRAIADEIDPPQPRNPVLRGERSPIISTEPQRPFSRRGGGSVDATSPYRAVLVEQNTVGGAA